MVHVGCVRNLYRFISANSVYIQSFAGWRMNVNNNKFYERALNFARAMEHFWEREKIANKTQRPAIDHTNDD